MDLINKVSVYEIVRRIFVKNITVIYGGVSSEKDVSKKSGLGVSKALESRGYNVSRVEYVNHEQLIKELIQNKPEFVYIALHGKFGEDGRIQSLLEILNIPYVGSGVLASALAMNKSLAKKHFKMAGIRVAKEMVASPKQISNNIDELITHIKEQFTYPLVIKPNQEGSTIGLTISNNEKELKTGLVLALKYDSDVMVEEYITGTEITVAVLGTKDDLKALPVIEIVPKNKYYDYESKYAPNGSTHIIPARISDHSADLAKKWAVKAHQSLGCETYSRVDFIVPKDEEPVILEINTLPGMTETSLFPDAAKSIGMSYEDMLENIIKIALEKYI